jgi:GH15 family glucan-1,4-alpha-glucosidase
MSSPIENYAFIGDCETAALVGRDGSIDWLCWPRFDSAACFAALLGGPEHGRWLLAPAAADARVTRRYLDDTLVLETRFETAEGTVTVTDFMPLGEQNASDLVRIVRCLSGRVAMRTELILRFDYGAVVPWVTRTPAGDLQAIAGPERVLLKTSVKVHGERLTTIGDFTLDVGESVEFVLTHSASHLPSPPSVDAERSLVATQAYWRAWIARCTYEGDWPEPVKRSLLTLKALTYAPTGGLVAAATTSLPEHIGGSRNWDYRYCWLRDSTLTLLALMDAGYHDEALAWRDWLLRAVAGHPSDIRIMYGVAGERRLPELELPWLPGYEGSLPVRIGNGAAAQLQHDVYGELMDALYQARCSGLPDDEHVGTSHGWALQRALVKHLEGVWQEPDEGIWEVRGARRHFTHSKVMAWVAFDRTIRSAEEFGLEGPVERWRVVRDQIHADVCERGYSHERGAFVQSYGSEQLDASLLLIPLVGFLPATDARVRGTLEAIGRDLTVDGLVLRYDTRHADDGLAAGEGAFLACSFWYADNLLLQGRRDEARALFERLLGLCNDVGLLAEEYDPAAQRQLGNFPQAFSHLALIGTALNFSRQAGPAQQRPSHHRGKRSPIE